MQPNNKKSIEPVCSLKTYSTIDIFRVYFTLNHNKAARNDC